MHHETSLLQLKMLARLQLLIKFIQWMLLGVHKEKAAIKWKWLSKKKKLPKFTFKFKLLYVTLFYSFVSLMDIIIWLFSTAKNSKVFYLFLKKVFATQQKLVEKMFNMLSKYNAGIWVKKNKHLMWNAALSGQWKYVWKKVSLYVWHLGFKTWGFFFVFCSDIHYLLLHQQLIVACACNNEAFSCGVCMFLHCLHISLGTPG